MNLVSVPRKLVARLHLLKLINNHTSSFLAETCALYPIDPSLPFSTNGYQTVTYSFPSVPTKLLAEQLTRIDVVRTQIYFLQKVTF